MYSGTPPYDHPVYKTTSLLRPFSFKPTVKTIESFYYFEDAVNGTTSLLRPGFYGPEVVILTGFHCIRFIDLWQVPFAQDENEDTIAKFSTVFLYFFLAIAKISPREMQLPNIPEIKYARKLIRIR